MNRVQNTKLVLWLLTGLAAAVGVTRFVFGLGVTTNLNDTTPWGLWIDFDVMGGVALAGGGFVLTAIFYMMRREEFHDLVRPAVLTAFLGYIAVAVGLMFDLGLPWNMWHMIIYWNPDSPLFEVGWCVMLYLTVLLLEFSPVPLEETSRYAKIRTFLMRFRFPLVLLGIMLSTLHQSSLGSLFLIMPLRVHPLWYSHLLPIQFFVSAVALGLMMVSFESLASHWLFRRSQNYKLVSKLAKGAVWVLLTYLIIRVADIAISGEFGLMFDGTWEGNLFLIELMISAIIPTILFSIRKVRENPAGQWIGSSMVILGMVMNRINVGGVTMLGSTGDNYFPSWMEISITLGVVSTAALVFLFAIEKFHIWQRRPTDPAAAPHTPASFGHTSEVWLGTPAIAARTKYSLAFVVAFSVGLALVPGKRIEGQGIDDTKAQAARGGKVLFVDGNRDGYGVVFDHDRHSKDSSIGECVTCHHMNLPQDQQSGCWNCHNRMYVTGDVFNHDWHASSGGGNLTCVSCHQGGSERGKESAQTCDHCHLDLVPINATVTVEQYDAPSYTNAMHNMCIKCHRSRAATDESLEPLVRCANCHEKAPPEYLRAESVKDRNRPYFNHVVLPGTEKQPGGLGR